MWNRRSAIGAIGIGAFVGLAGPAIAQETYIPVISKGFQHQFWQAVKQGAEQEAKKQGARITFEGPATELAERDDLARAVFLGHEGG